MFKLLDNLVRRKGTARRTPEKFVPQVEDLESRALLSVSSVALSGNKLIVQANNTATTVEVRASGSNVQIYDVAANKTWSYAGASVGTVEFQGGSANDSFVNKIANLAVRGFGNGGNDYLEGYNGNDYFDGGDGNDKILGYGGNDTIFGGAGNDILLGMDGDDQLTGGDGNDHLNGGAGNDKMWGQNGNDVLIALDNGTGDYAEGGAGVDAVWVDRTGSVSDNAYGATADELKAVTSFANGADRTLNGDRITDPTLKSGASYRTFSGYQLFSSSGPRNTDIAQGSIGDCWLLAGAAAVAQDSPNAINQNIVDFDDGTYGVCLGGKFYRVDNDLPVYNGTSSLAYAKLGAENSMWVAVLEKAFAHYRTGANSYASLEGGWGVEVNRAFGSTSSGAKDMQSYGNATNLVNDLFARWNSFQAVTIGFLGFKSGVTGVPLVMGHMYTVTGFVKNSAGVITGVILRNPWGVDGAGSRDSNPNDGFVTVTPAQLFSCYGSVNWGKVS